VQKPKKPQLPFLERGKILLLSKGINVPAAYNPDYGVQSNSNK
jgi:hypothetical protein